MTLNKVEVLRQSVKNLWCTSKIIFLNFICSSNINSLSTNPTKWLNTLKQLVTSEELFECVWPFCELTYNFILCDFVSFYQLFTSHIYSFVIYAILFSHCFSIFLSLLLVSFTLNLHLNLNFAIILWAIVSSCFI